MPNLTELIITHGEELSVIKVNEGGYSGFSGFSGGSSSGFSGFSSVSGYSGFSSRSGFSGFSGFSGGTTSGYSGFCGISGYSGFSSKSGYSGFSGGSGYSGFSAYSGFSGSSGFSGYCGASGFSAYSGYSGFSGRSGYSGFSAASPGASGYSGFSSASGYSGFSSVSGYSGYSGYSAFSGYSGPGGSYVAASADNTGIPINNTAYQTIVTKSVLGLAVNDTLIVEIFGTYLNNSGSTRVYSYQLNVGAVAVLDFADNGASLSSNLRVFHAKFAVSISATNVWRVMLDVGQSALPTAANTFATYTGSLMGVVWNSGTDNLTGTQTVSFKIKSADATATQTFTLHSYTIARIPQI